MLIFTMIIMGVLLLYFSLRQFVSRFWFSKKKVQEIDELKNDPPHLMDAIPLTSIYKNYIFRKLHYLKFTKLHNKYPFLNDYYVDGINYDRKHIERRLKAYTNDEYYGLREEFDKLIRIYMQKFQETEFPIIKNYHSYNLGVLPQFESFSYIYLINSENKDAEIEDQINEDLERERLAKIAEQAQYI